MRFSPNSGGRWQGKYRSFLWPHRTRKDRSTSNQLLKMQDNVALLNGFTKPSLSVRMRVCLLSFRQKMLGFWRCLNHRQFLFSQISTTGKAFLKEIDALRRGKPIERFCAGQRKPYIDLADGLMKVVNHAGVEHTLSVVKRKYYLTQGRLAVRKTLACCVEVKCRRRSAQPRPPIMANLPKERLLPFRPFSNSFLDFFGPFKAVIGRRKEKRYGLLITCFSTRAVPLELVYSLSFDSFLMALHRFIPIEATQAPYSPARNLCGLFQKSAASPTAKFCSPF